MTFFETAKRMVDGLKTLAENEGFDPASYFRGIGFDNQAHSETLATVGSAEQYVASQEFLWEGMPNRQVAKYRKNARIFWFQTIYMPAYNGIRLQVGRKARAEWKELNAQGQFSDEEKKQIRQALGI